MAVDSINLKTYAWNTPEVLAKRQTPMSTLLYHIKGLAKDILVAGILSATFPFRFSAKQPKVLVDPIPVLLVHGYMHNLSAWFLIAYLLAKNGYRVYPVNLGSPFHSIQQYAQKVDVEAKKIMQETGAGKIYVVGHSMGGLVASHLATDYEKNVAKVITIGSPMGGTKLASLAAALGLGECAKQMKHNSSFVQEQQKKNSESATKFYHLYMIGDPVIQPNISGASFQNPNAKRRSLFGGHTSPLYSFTTFKYILSALRE